MNGCDTVSSFYGKGKCKVYVVYVKIERKDDVTDVSVEHGKEPTDIISDNIDMLESFVLQLYGTRHDKLGAARLDKLKKSTDNKLCLVTSRKDALQQHIYRAPYQAGYLRIL